MGYCTRSPHRGYWAATILLAATILAVPIERAFGLITGGEGNRPIHDPGWPQRAAEIFNHPARIAWWEGPPFGGGQWFCECRGDTKAFNTVLLKFAKMDVKIKRIVIHNGVGHSFWLNPNREPAREEAARMDWMLMIWQPENWEHLRKLPAGLQPAGQSADKSPPAQIDVYTGGNLHWPDVVMPSGLEVHDQRLEAHGFAPADGTVLEGKVTDFTTQKPLAARIRLERVEPQPKGGYRYSQAASSVTDNHGRCVLKHAPGGRYRVIVEADGYVPRIAGYAQLDNQPSWRSYDCKLARATHVSGLVTDDAGKPLPGVSVRLADVVADSADGRYESPAEYTSTTDGQGNFRLDQVPAGKATVRLHKSGYCRPGLGQSIVVPIKDVALRMIKSAQVQVTVDFSGMNRPAEYIVRMEPEGGAAVGKWSGSGNINAGDQISFHDVPPGRYVLRGQPNPSSEGEQSKPIMIDLKGGQTVEITLTAWTE